MQKLSTQAAAAQRDGDRGKRQELLAKMEPIAKRIFFFKERATTEIYTWDYTLSLHDALPIWLFKNTGAGTFVDVTRSSGLGGHRRTCPDRKSTRLNSSHSLTSRMPSSA